MRASSSPAAPPRSNPPPSAAMPEVSRVLGNADKLRPSAFRFVRPAEAEVHVSDIFAVRQHAPHMAHAFAERARAFVEVQTGCDHRCTFCVIPFGRGNSRSVPAGPVIDRIAALVDAGHREVVLTGVDLTSYGADLPGAPTLAGLVERILHHVPRLPRLRLSSLDSIEIDDRLFAAVTQEPRIMPHLHLSLQSGDDMILKRMKRRHSRGDAVAMVARLKAARPEIAIGADLIAGFPTEDEAMAANTLALLDDCDVVFGHVFPFSARPGTPAARMPQLAGDVIRQRARTLREAAERRRTSWLATLAGTTQHMLVERDGLTGHAANFARIRLAEPAAPGPDRRHPHLPRRGRQLDRLPRMTDPTPWHQKLVGGFRRTSDKLGENLAGLFTKAALDRETLDGIEEALIASDLGPATAARIRARLADERYDRDIDEQGVRQVMAQEIAKILAPVAKPLEIEAFPRPQVILVIGVNGSGRRRRSPSWRTCCRSRITA